MSAKNTNVFHVFLVEDVVHLKSPVHIQSQTIAGDRTIAETTQPKIANRIFTYDRSRSQRSGTTESAIYHSAAIQCNSSQPTWTPRTLNFYLVLTFCFCLYLNGESLLDQRRNERRKTKVFRERERNLWSFPYII